MKKIKNKLKNFIDRLKSIVKKLYRRKFKNMFYAWLRHKLGINAIGIELHETRKILFEHLHKEKRFNKSKD